MNNIVRYISNNKDDKECVLVSFIEGSLQGEKILLANNEVVYKTEGIESLKYKDNNLSCNETVLSESNILNRLESSINDILSLGKDGIHEINGEKVFVERFGVAPRIIICGAGTVGQEVIKLGKQLDITVVVLEDREEFAEMARKLGADCVICKNFENGLEELSEKNKDYYVVLTREHQFDKVCLEKILNKKHAYVGLMSSRNRASIMRDTLINAGYDKEIVEEIHSPIGLSINAQTPAEIAVSICAEIIKDKNEKAKSEGFSREILDEILVEKEPTSMKGDCEVNSANTSIYNDGTDRITRKILATIVERVGSAPRDVGTKMLIKEDGKIVGSVGGGWIEAEVMDLASKMFETNMKCAIYETDKNSNDAILCGGFEIIYLEMI